MIMVKSSDIMQIKQAYLTDFYIVMENLLALMIPSRQMALTLLE